MVQGVKNCGLFEGELNDWDTLAVAKKKGARLRIAYGKAAVLLATVQTE
jgi:hypothetical protein